MNIFEQIQSEIENRVTAFKLGQIKLGVALAIHEYPTGAMSANALPSRTAYNAYMQYTKRRFLREQEAKKQLRRIANRRRGYSSTTV